MRPHFEFEHMSSVHSYLIALKRLLTAPFMSRMKAV